MAECSFMSAVNRDLLFQLRIPLMVLLVSDSARYKISGWSVPVPEGSGTYPAARQPPAPLIRNLNCGTDDVGKDNGPPIIHKSAETLCMACANATPMPRVTMNTNTGLGFLAIALWTISTFQLVSACRCYFLDDAACALTIGSLAPVTTPGETQVLR